MTLDQFIQENRLDVRLDPVVSVRRKSRVGFTARLQSAVPAGQPGPSPTEKDQWTVEFDRWFRRQSLAAFKAAGSPGLLFLGFDTAVLDLGVAGSGYLANQVRELALDPSEIVIAIRPSKVEDPGALKEFVGRHRSQGFLIGLKEVGVGHSNLERVALVRPDILNIGENLVAGLTQEFFSQEIIKSLATLSKKIGALLVAEGIATEAQALAALDHGVDMLEGPYFSEAGKNLDGQITALADRHRSFTIARSKALQRRVKETESLLSTCVRALSGHSPEEFDGLLAGLVQDHPSLECLFALNEGGIQESETHTRPGVAFKRSALFHPARPGADHSMKEYVYLLADAFVSRYRTEPYVSQASGNLCITLSGLFRDKGNRNHILCLDLPWHDPSLTPSPPAP